MHLIWLWKLDIYLYIYIVEKYTIIYYIWHTRASWEKNKKSTSRAQCLPLFLQGSWGDQLGLLGGAVFQSCSSSLFGECHFSYSPESESEWRSRIRAQCRPMCCYNQSDFFIPRLFFSWSIIAVTAEYSIAVAHPYSKPVWLFLLWYR